VVLSDDDEEIETTSSPITKKSAQREITLDGRTSQHASPAKKVKTRSATKLALSKVSPGSSPEKGRKNSKVGKASEQSKSLHNFFGRATEEQRWNRKSATPDVDLGNGELDDAIEDDELSDETLQELGLKTNKTTSANALDRRKPAVTTVGNLKREDNAAPLPSSQRFMRGTTTIKDGHPVKLEEHNPTPIQSQRPWADRYGPADLDELVVHKKKVSDVQNWLQGKISGQNNQVSAAVFSKWPAVC
jgi:cell cycle checkpoint protein